MPINLDRVKIVIGFKPGLIFSIFTDRDQAEHFETQSRTECSYPGKAARQITIKGVKVKNGIQLNSELTVDSASVVVIQITDDPMHVYKLKEDGSVADDMG